MKTIRFKNNLRTHGLIEFGIHFMNLFGRQRDFAWYFAKRNYRGIPYFKVTLLVDKMMRF